MIVSTIVESLNAKDSVQIIISKVSNSALVPGLGFYCTLFIV